MGGYRILSVESDEAAAEQLIDSLGRAGFEVENVASGRELFERLDVRPADLVLLDLSLPDELGLVVARKLRYHDRTPLVFLSDSGAEEDRLAALELGADDFLAKPFDADELVLRVRNIIARYHRRRCAIPGWRIEPAERIAVTPCGTSAVLSRKEFRIFSALLAAGGEVLSRDQLLDAMTGADELPSYRSVDTLIYRLRRKFAGAPGVPDYVVTVPGVGYRLAGAEALPEPMATP